MSDTNEVFQRFLDTPPDDRDGVKRTRDGLFECDHSTPQRPLSSSFDERCRDVEKDRARQDDHLRPDRRTERTERRPNGVRFLFVRRVLLNRRETLRTVPRP